MIFRFTKCNAKCVPLRPHSTKTTPYTVRSMCAVCARSTLHASRSVECKCCEYRYCSREVSCAKYLMKTKCEIWDVVINEQENLASHCLRFQNYVSTSQRIFAQFSVRVRKKNSVTKNGLCIPHLLRSGEKFVMCVSTDQIVLIFTNQAYYRMCARKKKTLSQFSSKSVKTGTRLRSIENRRSKIGL